MLTFQHDKCSSLVDNLKKKQYSRHTKHRFQFFQTTNGRRTMTTLWLSDQALLRMNITLYKFNACKAFFLVDLHQQRSKPNIWKPWIDGAQQISFSTAYVCVLHVYVNTWLFHSCLYEMICNNIHLFFSGELHYNLTQYFVKQYIRYLFVTYFRKYIGKRKTNHPRWNI